MVCTFQTVKSRLQLPQWAILVYSWLCWPFETIISMYKLLLLFHFVQSLTDCAANNSTISRGGGGEGSGMGVQLTPCDCCNANRSPSHSPPLWSGCHFYFPAYPETQNVHIPQKMALFCVTLARITTRMTTSWVRMWQRGWLRHVAGEICEQMVENDTAGPTLLHGNWATHGKRGNGQWCSR